MQHPKDNFERKVDSVLRETPRAHKIDKLLKLRRHHQASLLQIGEGAGDGRTSVPSAEMLNALNNNFLRQAEELLGQADFQRIFDIPAGQIVNVVDQTILDQANLDKLHV
ncbi:hypothetical protein FNU76_21905 [Chitinimonas arctica]|uniref:Uncharacterized protein n=1 Tax=Chitinimonas arctica TaxID=2594795 RepID=A0A516SKV2_9NEIS|nr:hypothetical protein [Chitinimonas arctica]QDQ28791.1 hypothetical protein FNU76_21905 [Chitinimonas arctica]